jgi:L-cysteine S-thiosulfotransferase
MARGRYLRHGGLLALLMLAGMARAEADPNAADGAVARGRAIVEDRSQGLCGLCHALPGQPAALQGTLGPPLAGVGARLTTPQLRERLLQPERFNPDTLMPAYGRSEGLARVSLARRGQPLLSATQIDDVVAYLGSLR